MVSNQVEEVQKYTQEEWAAKFGGGYKAMLVVSGKLIAPIKWETIKTSPLVKSEWRLRSDDSVAYKKYVADGAFKSGEHEVKKRLAFVDKNDNVVEDDAVKLVQLNIDGTSIEIELFEKSDAIEASFIDTSIMNDFLPESYVEIWSDDVNGQQELRKLAFELVETGKVAAVKKFVKARGTKAYVCFIYPIVTESTFRLEMVVSENKREAKRWMTVEPVEVELKVKAKKVQKEAKVPDLF